MDVPFHLKLPCSFKIEFSRLLSICCVLSPLGREDAFALFYLQSTSRSVAPKPVLPFLSHMHRSRPGNLCSLGCIAVVAQIADKAPEVLNSLLDLYRDDF